MQSPKLFQLTQKDKAHYRDLIKKVDSGQKDAIIKTLGIKIQSILNEGTLNSVEVELIEDMAELMRILNSHLNLPVLVVKKILFAMSYFIDENDEIPDVIPDYGYLDDITVVTWIMDDIKGEVPKIAKS
tara:strand:- start:296 stop:682 length:387 start_codon:yes stop_codon:yes gene_type:complete